MIPGALFFGKPLIRLREVDSSNNYAIQLLSKTYPNEGTCIITDYQTDGKGQIGRFWHSEPLKNILCSYILHPTFLDIRDNFALSMLTALAVRDLILDFNIANVSVKWPNDVYVADQKIAGILIQNVLRGTTIKHAVVGIGLNINQTLFPKELPNPTSIALETLTQYDLELVIEKLSFFLEKRYLQLKNSTVYKIKDDYISVLYKLNLFEHFQDNSGHTFEAKIIDISREGKLIVENKEGQSSQFAFREIQFLK